MPQRHILCLNITPQKHIGEWRCSSMYY